MKKTKLVLLAGIFSIATIGVAKAQNADEIIQKHIDAIGGTTAWNNIKTLKMKGSMSMMGMEIDMTQTVVNEKGMKMEINAGGQKGYTIITNTDGWMFMPGMDKVTKLPIDQVKLSQQKLNIKMGQLVDKSTISKSEYIGIDTINSAPCYKILITDKDGNLQTDYFDTKTYYMMRSEMKVKNNGEDLEVAISYDDFKKQPEGIVFPMKLGTTQGDIVFKTLEINKPVDENIFKPNGESDTNK